MNPRLLLLALAVAVGTLSLSACRRDAAPPAKPVATKTAPAESADQFVARISAQYKAAYPETTAAQWLSSTYINGDSQS